MKEDSFFDTPSMESNPITTICPFLKVNLIQPDLESFDSIIVEASTSSVCQILTPSISSVLKLNLERSKTSSTHSLGGFGFGPVQTNPPFHEKKYIPRFACSSQGSILRVRFE